MMLIWGTFLLCLIPVRHEQVVLLNVNAYLTGTKEGEELRTKKRK